MIKININKYKIPQDIPLVVGVSSGPDSMALLHLLSKTKYKIICTHINHNVRRQSQKEEQYLKEYCKQNNIIFESTTIKEYKENNFENEARKYRYKFYETIMQKYNTNYLFLAHHGDDLIETILMKITRGSNLEGFIGIKEISINNNKNYYIIRPLLPYTKEDLINYNTTNNIKYFIDKTNKEDICTRNRYRNKILPLLKKEDQNVHKKFLTYSKILEEYDNYIKKETTIIKKEVFINNILYIEKFQNLDLLIKKNIIYDILKDTYKNKNNIIKEKHIENILKIIESSKPNAKILLPQNIEVIKQYDKIKITPKSNDEITSYKLPLNDKIEINNIIIEKVIKTNENGNNICKLNSKNIKLPLYIRNRKQGDYIEPLGLSGKKKIKDIFIEKKILPEERNTYPLIVDSNDNILWVPNLKKSKFNTTNNENYDIILRYKRKEEKDE